MLAIKIWNFIKGYVIIRIEGLSLERLLNLALTNNIYLWDVKRLNKFQVEVMVSPTGVKDLENLINRVGCKGKILAEKGLPYQLKRLKRRKMFVIGFLLFATLLVLLSSFIWQIDINGIEQTPRESIIEVLEANKVQFGSFKRGISTDDVELILAKEFDYFSFIDVQIKGIKLIVEVKEEPIAPEKVDKSYPCNIVARKKGVITKIIARNGVAIVKSGQIVNENQVLISGVIESERTENIYLVHSEGEVLARTRYEEQVEEAIVKKTEKESGNTFKQKGLKLNNTGIKFMKDIPFKNYKEYIYEKNFINLDFIDIDLPIKFITYEYREIELVEIKQDIDYIKKANQLKAIEIINEQLSEGAEIVAKEVNHTMDGNFVKTTVIIETIEEISKKQIISN